jgi:serine/threonine protein kinase
LAPPLIDESEDLIECSMSLSDLESLPFKSYSIE